ncbi:MAG: hypothetical protein QW041_01070 [Candidatus Pacearchaeota archaeon]
MRLSKDKIDKIKEVIIAVLYRNSPKPMFTSEIASEIIRDEEFTKKVLKELESQKIVVSINKNPNGVLYSRRLRWRLSSKAFEAYNTIEKQKIYYNERDHTYT